ncbi:MULTISPECIES: hypothetical protein [Pseudomonas]|jgi:hypothetical protein|uniref:hypothetical protein n=1 Tax=Pseudomonas TaxID=286 RepID=UPI0005FB7EF5|nr:MULTISPECIES: hypothetical protein [Pseudomonas]KJZ34406.1 hypothetical protein VC33_24290 [Pseudomonas fluorescens]OOG14622.1 hypothetical protein BMS17_21780 [Pseudomonas sp. C9]
MSTDSSFDDKRPDSVPTNPEGTATDPVMDPNSPLRDPLARPVSPKAHPEGWRDPSKGDGIPDDDQMPLPND